jgi:16S rRNA (uracil1498-N3)-methyltransferase
MHRCLVNPGDWRKERIPVAEAEAHHLLHVLRLGSGDIVSIFDGEGRDATARVEIDGPGAVFLRMLTPGEGAIPRMDLTLIQAVPKGRRMDLLIEKCTELGVRTFAPVLTERTIVRPDEVRGDSRLGRWQRIADNAARQCMASIVPTVRPLRPLPEAIAAETGAGGFLVGSLQDDARPLREVLTELKEGKPPRITILIGPEGDLTEREIELARAHGAAPVSFGPLVFRVETAAIFVAAVIAYEFGELRGRA